jgi:hypothetical protein
MWWINAFRLCSATRRLFTASGTSPPVPDPYGSLTPAELATFGIGPARVSSDDNDEVQADDDEETEDDE